MKGPLVALHTGGDNAAYFSPRNISETIQVKPLAQSQASALLNDSHYHIYASAVSATECPKLCQA